MWKAKGFPGEAFLATLILLAGCASGGVQRMSETRWVQEIGRVTVATLGEGWDKVVRKHALQMSRSSTGGREIYLETTWRSREPVASEESRGVTHARNRIVIRGQGGSDSMSGRVFRMTWELQNEVTMPLVEGWHPDIIPPEVVESYRPVYSDLMLEVRTGLIRQGGSM